MSVMSPSTKTVQRFAQTMHQELWLLLEILLSPYSAHLAALTSLTPSEILPISRFERSDSFAYNAFPCLAPGLFFMPFHGTWEFYCLICQFPPPFLHSLAHFSPTSLFFLFPTLYSSSLATTLTLHCWFGILSKKCLKHEPFKSVAILQEKIVEFVETFNNF